MPNITEHDTKQERESHDTEYRRIGLLIVGDSIRISDRLEWSCELIRLEVSGRSDLMVPSLPDLRSIDISIHSHLVQGLIDCGRLTNGGPE